MESSLNPLSNEEWPPAFGLQALGRSRYIRKIAAIAHMLATRTKTRSCSRLLVSSRSHFSEQKAMSASINQSAEDWTFRSHFPTQPTDGEVCPLLSITEEESEHLLGRKLLRSLSKMPTGTMYTTPTSTWSCDMLRTWKVPISIADTHPKTTDAFSESTRFISRTFEGKRISVQGIQASKSYLLNSLPSWEC